MVNDNLTSTIENKIDTLIVFEIFMGALDFKDVSLPVIGYLIDGYGELLINEGESECEFNKRAFSVALKHNQDKAVVMVRHITSKTSFVVKDNKHGTTKDRLPVIH